MSTRDEIDGESAEARAQSLHGEYQFNLLNYERQILRRADPTDRDARRAEIRNERDRLISLYQDDVVFKTYVLALAAKRADADPTGVIYDLLRSGFAPLVLALGQAAEVARQATLKALQTQRIEMVVPAEHATSERAPDWLRTLIADAKRDQEAGAE